jgi:FlaG/FlaF family flagellin (archaellin)
MKTNNSDLVAKILITAVIVVLTGLLIAWMAGLFKDKKQDLNSGTGKIDDAINSIADFDLLVYDGNTISGETLTELIKEFEKKDIAVSIWVNTLDANNAYYNYAFTPASSTLGASDKKTPPTAKTSPGYVTPSANFLGEVIKNSNDEIVCLKFTQQK